MLDHIAQAIVTAVAAGLLEPHRAWRQIDVIVHEQHLLRRDAIEVSDCSHRAATLVHERSRFGEPQFALVDAHAGQIGLQAPLVAPTAALTREQRIDEPPARIVARARVLLPRVTETDDE